MKKNGLLALAAALLTFAGCQSVPGSGLPTEPQREQSVYPERTRSSASVEEQSDVDTIISRTDSVTSPEDETANPYIGELIRNTADKLVRPGMTEYERAKAAFDYMIENTVLDDPVGQDLWRVHGGGEEPIPFVEQRALSPLRFGVGMCEDYAAALTMLLRGLGLEAEYVPGLTYSLEGHLVDHAWTMVRIDGVWYHLDCQLEDNISRHGTVRYRYFLKSDATLSASHLWGQRLISSGLLTREQNAELAAHYLAPDCPKDYATPEPHPLKEGVAPDLKALREQVREEIAAYEAENGPLPPMELNTTPPVFGLNGFGPADEG
ncbi:transglutaminase domain-containing protein [Harryflintia acetispora]|uniref:transglutaminase domain-containing protein n=1 Tax=Harryflintia acetispora TaxID=1849041 RepID=UPI00189B2A12|nr:transglutaminase-like domain-containing protein [Harryflintia acetispora]